MTADAAKHLIWLTLELSEARAQAHSFRELWLLSLGLYGDCLRENRRLERSVAAARRRPSQG